MYIRNLRPHFDPNLKSLFLRPQFILGKIEEQIHSLILDDDGFSLMWKYFLIILFTIKVRYENPAWVVLKQTLVYKQ